MRLATVLIAVAGLALFAVWMLAPGDDPGSGTFPVEVAGPEGPLFVGNVTLDEATAYTVLLAAAGEAGLEVESTGTGEHLLVTAIGEHRNAGSGGWCYAVWEDRWVRPAHSAAVAGLSDGQSVRWSYEQDGCGALG